MLLPDGQTVKSFAKELFDLFVSTLQQGVLAATNMVAVAPPLSGADAGTAALTAMLTALQAAPMYLEFGTPAP